MIWLGLLIFFISFAGWMLIVTWTMTCHGREIQKLQVRVSNLRIGLAHFHRVIEHDGRTIAIIQKHIQEIRHAAKTPAAVAELARRAAVDVAELKKAHRNDMLALAEKGRSVSPTIEAWCRNVEQRIEALEQAKEEAK